MGINVLKSDCGLLELKAPIIRTLFGEAVGGGGWWDQIFTIQGLRAGSLERSLTIPSFLGFREQDDVWLQTGH